MKNRKLLDVTEYALLAGSGVGSLAAIATQQVAFATAPVSFLLLLNLVNRHRMDQQVQETSQTNLAQVDERLTKQMEVLDRRIQGLPTFWDLASLRKAIMQKNRTNLTRIHEQLSQRLETLEEQTLGQVQRDLGDLKGQHAKVIEAIERVTANVRRVATLDQIRETENSVIRLQGQVETLQGNLEEVSRVYKPSTLRMLQGQIDYINRRFNTMPNPVDTATLKQDVEGLMQLIGELLPRREFVRLVDELEQLRCQYDRLDEGVAPLRTTGKILRRQVQTLAQMVQANAVHSGRWEQENPDSAAAFATLKTTVEALQKKMEHAPSEADLVSLQSQVDAVIANQLEPLKQDLTELQEASQGLQQQQQSLYGWINRLPEMLDFSSLRNQMKYLTDRMDRQEVNIEELGLQLATVPSELQTPPPPDDWADYELVFDLQTSAEEPDSIPGNSRVLLESALKQAQSRLIVVFPYPDRTTFDRDLIEQFQTFLDQGGTLDIGWGYLGDGQQNSQPRYIHQRTSGNPSEKTYLQQVLSELTQLKRKYPTQFRFKVLGTNENFLVCDHSYALLGFQPIATRSMTFPKVAVGLRTTASEVVEALIDRFENPVLTETDAEAYFNRALTRYALDDKQGAIADYTQVIQVNPDHDVAYNNRGLVRYELGNKEGAIADLNRAILVNPSNSIAYCNRGVIRAELGNPMGAIEDYSYAIHVDSSCIPAYFHRGLARTQMGNKMGSIEDFSDVISLNEQDASAYFYRGMARTKLGDRIGAIRDLKEAAKLFNAQGNANNYQQALNTINQLQKSLVIEGSGESIAKSS
ncbi:MAG: tetratricopeptide repeat protein [Synechococcales bacterium]|nr:tetratricopeptide repeat protein [Synechococcales bacterium]